MSIRLPARAVRHVVLALAPCLLWPDAAPAEIVRLTTGRSVSVRRVQEDGDRLTLALRSGGEVVVDRALVESIAPDEVVEEAAPGLDAETPLPASDPLTGPYHALVVEAARKHGLDPSLIHAVIRTESNYERRARSPKGARGLMQLMPATLSQYAVRDAFDPASNIEAGARYLRSLIARYGELGLALAAYNAGPGAVDRHGGIPPYPETRRYVTAVLRQLDPRGTR